MSGYYLNAGTGSCTGKFITAVISLINLIIVTHEQDSVKLNNNKNVGYVIFFLLVCSCVCVFVCFIIFSVFFYGLLPDSNKD